MVKNDDSQTFSCISCGAPYTVYPPQTGYGNARLEPCTEGCNKEMNVKCKGCGKDTKIYWCTGHLHIYSGSPNYDTELDRSYPF